jgi:hypothetical protein
METMLRSFVLMLVLVLGLGLADSSQLDGLIVSMSLDHERLDAYRVAIEFLAWTGELLDGPLATVRLAAKKHIGT